MEENFNHVPVLLNECIEGLNIKPDGVYVDCTLGGGGHSGEIAKRLTTGRLISIDKDEDAIAYSKKRLEAYKDKITFVHDDFKNIESILKICPYRQSTAYLPTLACRVIRSTSQNADFLI